MLLKIKETSTVFAKVDMKQHKNTCFSSCLSLNQIKKFLHMFFRTVEHFSNSIPRPPGKENLAKTQPLGSENVQIPGGRPGEDGQALN